MLFEQFVSPRLELRNRLAVAPMATFSGNEDGSLHPDEVAFLARRAKGGFGLIITGACFVHPTGRAFDGQWGCESDSRIADLRIMADAIHAEGAKAYLQIHHGGRACPARLCGETVAPSVFMSEKEGAPLPRELTCDEVWDLVTAFADAARRAKEAGYDGVEIHGANGYLLQQFFSPMTNLREDMWGQPMTFPGAVVKACLEHAGDGFEVGYRLSPEESEKNGIHIKDTLKLVDWLADEPLAYIHLSTWSRDQKSTKDDDGRTFIKRVAEQIGGRVPLIGVGGVKEKADAEYILLEGADVAALGRSAISDPEWPIHAQNGFPVKVKYPRIGGHEALAVPKGLDTKMVNVPGWMDLED